MSKKETKLETLIVTRDDGLATVTLDHPPMNTISTTLTAELTQVMRQLADDDQVRGVLINARGRTFCAGAELVLSEDGSPPTSLGTRKWVVSLNDMYLSILNAEKPVVCAVNGIAVGGGFTLVLACDMVIASEAATFTTVFLRRGLFPDVGVNYLLPRIVGLHKAKELIFTADAIDAKEAERIGIVNKVVPAERLDEEARAIARRLASAATKAIGLSKTVMHYGLGMDMRSTFEFEAWGQGMCILSEDTKEGVMAFLEKRPPVFKGK